mgnify:CR=1 FL=1
MSDFANKIIPSGARRIFESLRREVLSVNSDENSRPEWKKWERYLFRFTFIFLLFLIIPIDPDFYRNLFAINWLDFNFYDLFRLAVYLPDFTSTTFGTWGLGLVVALIGTQLWTVAGSKSGNHVALYYWLRTIVRYRLAIGLLAYGFIKLFPIQAPYPSLSNLLTNYGDFYAWKIYFQTLGIAPTYQSFLGFVEILAALLLFYRKTVTFGAGLVIGFLGNVAVANGFYGIGEEVFSTFLVLLSVVLISYDVPRLWSLLIDEKFTRAAAFVPDFSNRRLAVFRFSFKVFFVLVVALYEYKVRASAAVESYKLPRTPGLEGAYGYYDVQEFVLNGDTIAQDPFHPYRWQNVIFEQWSTLTVKDNRPVIVDRSRAEAYHENDLDRNYELAGFAGRHYYHYEVDTLTRTLALQNKNPNHREEHFTLSYSFVNDSTLVLHGTDFSGDTIRATLGIKDKRYMMFEGRRRPVKI